MPPRIFRSAPDRRHSDYSNRLARISAMRDRGHTQREIAGALGISKQRVQQLIKLLPALSSPRGREK